MVPFPCWGATPMLLRALSSWGRLVGRREETKAAEEEERRIWVRHPSAVETTCRAANDPGAAALAARVGNVSRGGINLVVIQEFVVGELLSVELPNGGDEPTCTVLAYVVRAEALPGGDWSLGCTFAAELRDDDLEAFGARRARLTRPDQRGWVRFPCPAQASFRTARDPGAATCPARVLNISAGGIGLEVDTP